MAEMAIIILALIIDILFGELPNRYHPVAWLGKLINLELRIKRGNGKFAQILFGFVMLISTTLLLTTLSYLFLSILKINNEIIYVLAGGLLFKFTFSIRGLISSASHIKNLMENGDFLLSKNSLSALVSRNTESLNREGIIAATVESVSENSCDSFIAPVFYFILFGVPGAIAYRIINTFDSMIGYHGKYEYIGKCAAIADDVINFIPARISALLIILASVIWRQNGKRAWSTMVRDHKKTESPNAGWTMSAMAGALGIQLNKTDCYQLGYSVNTITTSDIDKSLKIVIFSFIIWSVLTILLKGILVVAVPV